MPYLFPQKNSDSPLFNFFVNFGISQRFTQVKEVSFMSLAEVKNHNTTFLDFIILANLYKTLSPSNPSTCSKNTIKSKLRLNWVTFEPVSFSELSVGHKYITRGG